VAEKQAQQRPGQLRRDGQVARRSGRGPQLPASAGSALIFSQAEVRAFVADVKDGDFDSLLQ
jgi:hypothetical protein